MTKPTIVFVPGSWHVPAHYDHVREHLEQAGYTCVAVELPTTTHHPRPNGRLVDMQDDIAVIRNNVMDQLDSGKSVILVTHSYSSMPGCAALAGLNAASRKASGHSTYVRACVIISGFLVPSDQRVLTVMGATPPPHYWPILNGDATLPFAGPGAIEVLYHDLDTNEALKAVWKLVPQSWGVLLSTTPDQISSLQGVDVWYLATSEDRALPWESQVQAVKGFRGSGLQVHCEIAATSHSPFLKDSVGTAKFIRKAAGENVESGFVPFNDDGSRP